MTPAPHEGQDGPAISLSLVSHTNVGKTTLARTLLGRDIGEVRDEAHVTEQAEAHELVRSADGDRLLLWDTPGFGDSLRLARRLAQARNPLGWLMTEVWDRWRDRPFWATQRAVGHVMAQTDVVLYLVNAAESPADAAYLEPELQVLSLIGKPVIALLNQVGMPEAADEAALIARWREHLAGSPIVQQVLPLDAFTRCWVQEAVLWRAVATALPPAQAARFAGLQGAWLSVQHRRFEAAMDELARRLVRISLDREPLPEGGWRGRLSGMVQLITRRGETPAAQEAAQAVLAERLDQEVRLSITRLIRLHELQGDADRVVLAQLARHYALREPLDEGRAAVWGGLVAGALAGLKADLVTGGLTLGGGLLAGGVIGALSAAGAAHGVNRLRGVSQAEVAWQAPVLDALVANALLSYLAVAHHGRGRGAWVALNPPARWTEAVAAVQLEMAQERAALWQRREKALESAALAAAAGPSGADGQTRPTAVAVAQRAGGPPPADAQGQALETAVPDAQARYERGLREHLRQAGQRLLSRLYPEGPGWH